MDYAVPDYSVGPQRQSHTYNIKAVVKQTGLNPATIRAWERRYGFPKPQRTGGGHRQYSQRDIDTLKWLAARQDEGISISHAVELWQDTVRQGLDPLDTAQTDDKQPEIFASPISGTKLDDIRHAWIDRCLDFDREAAEQILSRALALFSPETVCIEILQKGLAQVGMDWYDGKISIQQEHFVSALSIQRLEMLIAAAPAPSRPERVMVATAPNDYHVFSPLLLAYLLRRRGWDVIYLGADVPAVELESTIDQVQPGLVIISAQLLHTAANLKDLAHSLTNKETAIAFGGLTFNHNPSLRTLIPGHFLGETITEAVQNASVILSAPGQIAGVSVPDNEYLFMLNHFIEKRSLIEAHIWHSMLSSNHNTKDLTGVNDVVSETIQAVLRLGKIDLLQPSIQWLSYQLVGYRLDASWIQGFIDAYYQAVVLHLGESGRPLSNWLSQLRTQIE